MLVIVLKIQRLSLCEGRDYAFANNNRLTFILVFDQKIDLIDDNIIRLVGLHIH